MRRVFKYGTYTLGVLAILLSAAVITTQTAWFRERLRGYVVRAANERLTAQVGIDRVEGNLFRHIELAGVRLVQEGDTLASVSSIAIHFRPRRLLVREIRVDSLLVDAPRVALRRRPDGSWNFSNIVKASPEARAEKEAQGKLPFEIRLDRVALRGGALFIDSEEPAIPSVLTDLDMAFSAYWGEATQTIELTELRFRSAEPPIVLETLTFAGARTREGLTVSDLSVRTSRNALKGRGFYSKDERTASSGSLETEPLDLSALKPFLPALELHVSPTIALDAHLKNDTLSARIELKEGRESLFLDASVYELSKVFDEAARDGVGYSIRGAADSLDVARWSGNPKIDFVASGSFDLRGKGISPEGAGVQGSFDLGSSTIRDIKLQDLAGTLSYVSGDVSGTFDATGRFGRLAAKVSVAAVSRERRFDVSVLASDIDLASLTGRDSLQSRLNLAATAHGNDLGRRLMEASIEMRMSPSAIHKFEIDTVFADAVYASAADRVLIRRFHGRTAAGTLSASGEVGLVGPNSLSYVLELGSLADLRGVIPADTLRGTGRIEGVVSGRIDSVMATGRFSLAGIAYNAFGADSAGGDFSILYGRSGISGRGSATLSGIAAFGDSVASISAALDYAGNALDLATDVAYRDSIGAHVEASVTLGEEPVIVLRAIRLDLPERTWSGGSPETVLLIERDSYRIENFSLLAPGGGTVGEREISVDGTFSLHGEEDLRVRLSGLDVASLTKALKAPVSAEGSLYVEAELKGTARDPRIEGKIEVVDILAPPFKCKSISAGFGYREQRFAVNGFIEAVKGPRVTFDGFAPLALSFEKNGSALLKNEPWELTVKGRGIPVGSFSASSAEVPPVSGFIDLDVRGSSTFGDPEFAGAFSVREGAFAVPSAGIDCKHFALGVSFDRGAVTIDSLRADLGEGFVAASGSAAFDGRVVSGKLASMRFDLTARNLYLTSRKKFEILFSGDLKVEGTEKESGISGAFTIAKSRFFLPSLTVRGPGGRGEALPLLVAALKQTGQDSVPAPSKPERPSALKRFGEVDFVNRMEGSVRISLPSGTWLRSPETSIEIGGDMEVVKHGTRLEFFGPIQILRGQYTLFGKRFQITEGTLTFKGGEKINPDISMKADYVFRTTDGDKKTVTAVVTGEARSPVVRFTLDGKDITETDAVSYITTGRSMEDMAQTGGTTSSESGGSSGTEIAASAAAGMLAGQLAYTLGGSTSLDVLDIDTQNSWQNATVTVGKYLSPSLFVSYQAGIGQFDQDEIDPNAVTLEYRVSRLFYLHLIAGDSEDSGLGFLLKYER